MTKILIVKRDKLGDLLLTTPLIEILSSSLPHGEIHVWATAFTTFVVESHPSVKVVWPMQKHAKSMAEFFLMLKQLVQIRRQRYDWIIVASGEASYRAMRRARLAGGRRLIAFSSHVAESERAPKYKFIDWLEPPQGDLHESLRIAKLAEPILNSAISSFMVPLPRLYHSAESTALGSRFIERSGLFEKRFVVIGLGARKEKRQPSVRQVLAWADWLKRQGFRTVLSYTPRRAVDPGYPSDADVADEIIAEDCSIVPLAGDIQEAVAVIFSAAFSVIPDSGLMHVAAASPGGVIGLFADPERSPSPEQWGPRGVRCRLVIARELISSIPDNEIFKIFSEFSQQPL